MLNLLGFQGEVPRVERTMLEPQQAARTQNLKLETGALVPYRIARKVAMLAEPAATIYNDRGSWLSWSAEVDVVPGPVATDRLYITGNGVPKLRVEATEYPLAVPRPTVRPNTAIRWSREYLTIDGATVRLDQDRTVRATTNNWRVEVSVSGSTAAIRCTHDGASDALVRQLVNGLGYSSLGAIPSLKIVRIRRIQDNGGQTYDANRNPLGSDTRAMDDVGTTVRVGGTSLEFSFPTPETQSNVNVAAQNDPPTLTTNGRNPEYPTAGAPAVQLFDSTQVSTIEGGQQIILLELEIEGLTNGVVDQSLAEGYNHAYTYVTIFDEESAPSPLSRGVLWSSGQVVRVSGLLPPPAGREINRIRIYRTQTGDTGQTDLYFVGEVPANATFFDDNLDEIPLQEPINTIDFDPPPAGLTGLVSMPNGMMAGFVGKEVFFSEPYKPHAWPRKYSFTVDWRIVGLASIGSALVILTRGQPFIAEGTHPENMRARRLEVDLPCVSKASIVDFGGFVAYASTRGLVVVDGAGARVVTEHLFTERQWRDLKFWSMRGAQLNGRYILSYDEVGEPRRCIILDLTRSMADLIRTAWPAKAFHYQVGAGGLFILDADRRTIREFDSQDGPYSRMRWDSKVFLHPEPVNYGRILVSAEPLVFANRRSPSTIAVRVFADGKLIATIGAINAVVPLPSGFMARRWQVSITGTHKVSAVYLAHSPEEIAKVAQL